MALTLLLGDFEFLDFELPEVIPFGSAQQIAVKKMIGGVRDMQTLGPDPRPIEWSGIFFPMVGGVTALDRALQVQQMVTAAQPVNLLWDRLFYQVYITKFEPDYRFARIPYKITCEVLQDFTAPINTGSTQNSDDLLDADLNNANTLTATTGDTKLSGLMSSVTSAFSNVSTFVGATMSEISSVLQPIHAAATYLTSAISQADSILGKLGVPAGVLPSTPILTNIANFTAVSNAASLQPAYLQISSLLGRMQVNLGQVNSSAKTITVGGGNLFDIASKQYGDSTAWTQIAQANGIKDPTLTGITTLVIPPYSANSDGILSA